MIKESFERQKERLKFKRINEDEPYEDGENFDSHVGKFRVISNPYELLEKMETADEDDADVSDDSSIDDDKKLDVPLVGLKRSKPDSKFDTLMMFKKPEPKKTNNTMITMMKKVKTADEIIL